MKIDRKLRYCRKCGKTRPHRWKGKTLEEGIECRVCARK